MPFSLRRHVFHGLAEFVNNQMPGARLFEVPAPQAANPVQELQIEKRTLES
jgi:hypothetical protein